MKPRITRNNFLRYDIFVMNILFVTETYLPFIGGVSTSSNSIAQFMASKGHKVTLVCPTPILKDPEPAANNLTIIHTPSVHDPAYRGKPMTIFPFGFFTIWKTLITHPIDIIHIQEPGSLGISALIAAKILHKPTVGALHFTPDQVARMATGRSNLMISKLTESYIRFIYNKFNAIMVPTQTFADFLKKLQICTPVQVVSNGVDTNIFAPAPRNESLRKKYGITKEDFVILYVGRIDKDKNVRTLILAMQHTQAHCKLIIAGSGKEKDILIDLAKRFHVQDKITWLGSISDSEMISLYHVADCFCIMAEFEVQSIVTLQAIAIGLPTLAARAGALPELAQDKINGYTIPSHDYKTLAEKMNYLSAHPETCKIMGAESRRISMRHHKPTALATLVALYKKVITSHI